MAGSNLGVTFITDNPGTEAYNAGVNNALQQEAAERSAQGQILTNAQNLAEAPSRLKRVQADASLAGTNADVATRTADSKVSTAQSGARTAGATADVAQGTVGSRIAESGANAATAGANAAVAKGTIDSRIASSDAAARTAGAGADVAQATVQPKIDSETANAKTSIANSRLSGANADVGEQTVDSRVQSAQAGARSAQANAVKAEMDGFYKSLDLLNQGDPASAQEVARRTGTQIPDQIVNDAALRKELTDAANYAKTYYPNRPKDQQAYIQGFLKQRASRIQQGAPTPDPTAVYSVPETPTPQQTTTDPKSGEIERIIGNLREEYALKNPGKTLSYQDAVEMARRGSRADELGLQRERLANSAARADPAFATDPQVTLEKWRGQYGLPSRMPQGAGTREKPYTATTQDQVDWFKRNAPAGSVLSVGGQLLTK